MNINMVPVHLPTLLQVLSKTSTRTSSSSRQCIHSACSNQIVNHSSRRVQSLGMGPKKGGRNEFGLIKRGRGLDGAFTGSEQRRWMSVRPADPSAQSSTGLAPRKKVTLDTLRKLHADKIPITVMTAYDYPTALLNHHAMMDMTLVGDSLSQVCLGHSTTTQITLDEMLHHCKAVARGAKAPFLFADLPFGSFESSVEKGVEAAIRMVKEGGMEGIKIEGGEEIIPLVRRLSSIGIPVMPHLGLQPQRATASSGYLVQARKATAAIEVLRLSKQLQSAGAFAILLEAIPHPVATRITQELDIPTIGIGAGPGTSGQVLVVTDVMGTYPTESDPEGGLPAAKPPKFVRTFGSVGKEARRAVREYASEVRSGSFPAVGKETYKMADQELEEFLEQVERQTTKGGKDRGSGIV